MPSLEDVYDALFLLGYPLAYHHFNEPPASIPYIVYWAEGYDSIYADDSNYLNKTQLVVEVYQKNKLSTVQAEVEGALSSLGLCYTKDELWIEEEQIYEAIYESEVL